jgi:hypothetical protein
MKRKKCNVMKRKKINSNEGNKIKKMKRKKGVNDENLILVHNKA